MASEAPLTPEKQLLNLIEKPMAKNSLRQATTKYQRSSFFSLSALKARALFLKNKFFNGTGGGVTQFDIKVLNNGLTVGSCILSAYLVISVTSSSAKLKKGIDFSLSADELSQGRSAETLMDLKASSYYLEKARERDIFSLVQKRGGEEQSQQINDLTAHLRLVGISWSGDPDVMIEDAQSGKTLFLKQGRIIEGGIKVEKVFKDKVVLSYEGAEIELR